MPPLICWTTRLRYKHIISMEKPLCYTIFRFAISRAGVKPPARKNVNISDGERVMSRLSAAIAFIILLTSLTACGDPTMDYLRQGDTYYDQGQFVEAIAEYTKAIERNPSLVAAYTHRGAVYNARAEWDMAIADLSKAIELEPGNADNYQNRAFAYLAKKQYDPAITDLVKTVELDPGSATAYTNLSWLYVHKEQWDKAIETSARAIELDPNSYDSYYNRGIAYYRKEQLNKALADFNRVIEINHNIAPAYSYIGLIYLITDNATNALGYFDRALQVDPDLAEAYKFKGVVYATFQQYDKAIENLNTAIQLEDTLAMAYYYRGHVYNNNQEWDRALDDLNRALTLGTTPGLSTDSEHLDLARIYLEHSLANRGKMQLNEAIADAQKATENDPNNARAFTILGEMFIINGDLDEAFDALNKSIKLDPNLPEAYFNRAMAWEIYAIQVNNYSYYENCAADLRMVIKLNKEPEQVEEAQAAIRRMQSKGYIP